MLRRVSPVFAEGKLTAGQQLCGELNVHWGPHTTHDAVWPKCLAGRAGNHDVHVHTNTPASSSDPRPVITSTVFLLPEEREGEGEGVGERERERECASLVSGLQQQCI